MPERQSKTGAGLSVRERGAIRKRLDELSQQSEDGTRDLGIRILDMHRADGVSPDEVRAMAAKLDALERAAAELDAALRGKAPPPKGRPPQRAKPEPTAPAEETGPRVRPVIGAAEATATPPTEVRRRRPPPEVTQPEVAERPALAGGTESAVEAARRAAEERATGEIMALEEDLERERERASDALNEVQLRLEEAEQRAAETGPVTDEREDAAGRLPERPEDELKDEIAALTAKLDEDRAVRVEVLAAADRRLRDAEARASSAENARLDAEIDARDSAANWIRGQAESMRREARHEAKQAEAAAFPPQREADEPEAKRSSRAEARAAGKAERAESRRVKADERRKRAEAKREERRKRAEAKQEERAQRAKARKPEPATAETPKGEPAAVNVNEATFEQLRDLGMSVTQATRVIAYRERQDGFKTVDDLDSVPGFPKPFLADVKKKLAT